MTPRDRALDFHDRLQTAIVTGQRSSFDYIKELTKVIDDAVVEATPKRQRKVWTDAKLRHFKRLLAGGTTVAEVAAMFGVSVPRAYQVIKEYTLR